MRKYLTIAPFLVLLVLGTVILYFTPLYGPRIVADVTERVITRQSDGRFEGEIEGLQFSALDRIQIAELVLRGTVPDRRVRTIRVRGITVEYDLLALFAGRISAAARDVAIENVEVTFRTGTAITTPPESDSGVLERLSGREEALFAVLERYPLPAGLTVPIKLLATTGETEPVTIADASITIGQGKLTGHLASGAYRTTFAATIPTEPVTFSVSGPGVSAAASVTAARITVTGDLVPPEFSLPKSIATIATDRLDETVFLAPFADTLSIAGEIVLPENVNAAHPVSTAGGELLKILSEATGEATFSVPASLLGLSATVEAVGLRPGALGAPVPDTLMVPGVHISLSADGTAVVTTITVDGGALGSLSVAELRVPREDPRRFTIHEARLSIDAGAPIPATLAPPALESLVYGADAVFPGVTVQAWGDGPGRLVVEGTIDQPERFRIDATVPISVLDRTVTDAVIDLVLSGPATVADVRTTATGRWDSLAGFGFGSIPEGLTATTVGTARYRDNPIEFALSLADGTIVIDRMRATVAGTRYALADTAPPPLVTVAETGYRLSPMTVALRRDPIDAKSPAAPSSYTGIQPSALSNPSITFAGVLERGGVIGEIGIQSVPIEYFSSPGPAPPRIRGPVNGAITFDTRSDPPLFEVALRGDPVTVFDQAGSFDLILEQDETSLEVRSGSFRFDSLLTASIAGRLPLTVGPGGIDFLNLTGSTITASVRSARFDRFFQRDAQELVPEGALSAELYLEERTGKLTGSVNFRTRPAPGTSTALSGFGYENLTGRLELSENRYDRLTLNATVTADRREIVSATAEAHIPGLARAAPTRSPEEITWRLQGRSDLPLEYIAPFLPGVVALTGELTGEIAGGGVLASPQLSGGLTISDGELRLSGSLPRISAIEAAIRFDGTRYFSERITAETGLAPFSVSLAGTLPANGASGSLEARLTGQNLLVFSSPTIRVRSDLDIAFRGSNDSGYLLGGTMEVTDALYSQDIPLIDFDAVPRLDTEMLQLFSVRNELGARTSLDLSITADETFRVENNIYRGAFSADLTLGGTLEIPRPQGRVFADTGRLQLPLTSLDLQQAVLRFPRDRPFSPELQARGTTRLRDYQVSVSVAGTLPGVEVDVATTPALPQSDALVLLSTGFTPADISQSGNRTALAIGSRLGTQFVQALVGTEGGAAGGDLANRVSVVLGEGVSDSGSETVEIEFRLSDQDSWFLVFRRDRYERYNMDLAWRFWLE